MATQQPADPWSDGQSYERYMGRWSRLVAAEFLAWLDAPEGTDWLDVGCGTGALTAAVLASREPRSVLGVDASPGFVAYARQAGADLRARFEVGSASALLVGGAAVDLVVSALAYNFFPDRAAALAEMRRVARPGGTVAFYVWDYPNGGMGVMEAFWKAARRVEPAAESHAEAARFPFCTRETLTAEAEAAGLTGVQSATMEATARFETFEDLWDPFLAGVGPAPLYLAGLEESRREAIRLELAREFGRGSFEVPLRAWAVRGSA